MAKKPTQSPNKYEGNEKIRPDTPLKTLLATGQMLLMVVGIIGIAMQIFGEGGMVSKILGYLFGSTTGLIMIPIIGVGLYLFNKWISSPSKDTQKSQGNLPMYLMMFIGAFFLFKLLTTGSL